MASIDQASICLINTCCVTNKAESKSRYFINRAIRSKNCQLIIILGCLTQLNPKIIENKKIGIVIGSQHKQDIGKYIIKYKAGTRIQLVNSFKKNSEFEVYETYDFKNNTRAFMKIQDGCNFMCSYCVIPFVRGRQRSLSHLIILERIRKMIANDCKEIILTGVNTAGYRDSSKYGFYELLEDINELKGDFRVRISSLEPFQIDKKIIDLITNNPNRWCQQFHICIQSTNDEVIKKMRRKYSLKEFINLCKYIRIKNKFVSITTDYIVGFPTETSDQFIDSLKNLNILKFSDMHLFPFSSRPFTVASKLKNIVSDSEKKMRFMKINKLNIQLQNEYLRQFIGKTVNVLFENSNKENTQSGHSEYFFMVNINTSQNLTNKLLKVLVVSMTDNQLFGRIV